MYVVTIKLSIFSDVQFSSVGIIWREPSRKYDAGNYILFLLFAYLQYTKFLFISDIVDAYIPAPR